MRSGKRCCFLWVALWLLSGIFLLRAVEPFRLTLKFADYQRGDVMWFAKEEERAKHRAEGRLVGGVGWIEHDFKVPRTGWYELWMASPPGWNHHIWIDGVEILRGIFPEQAGENDFYKARNVWLKGETPHVLKTQMLHFPGFFSSAIEFREGSQTSATMGFAAWAGPNVARVGEKLKIAITAGGLQQSVAYTLLMRPVGKSAVVSKAEVSFAATAEPTAQMVEISCPEEGAFELVGAVQEKAGEGEPSALKELGQGDLRLGKAIVVDTRSAPAPAAELKKTLVVDIDCAQERASGFWEKDGKSTVVTAPFGRYRESSGRGTQKEWATDGFSYSFDLPEANVPYQLEVDYPDDDRRTMGFWVNDQVPLEGANADLGAVMTGGVETGDHYRLTHRMLTHEALFYPRKTKNLIAAVVNLTPGTKAAASRIRIYKIDGPLTAGPPNRSNGRRMGYYFEEPSRWLRHFGASSNEMEQHLLTLDRWAQMCRYTGANLFFPTINVYQANAYPSKILEGYSNSPFDQPRIAGLVAEKYGLQFIPEFHLSGQAWFDKHTMGVWSEEKEKEGKKTTEIKFASPEAEECVLRDNNGNMGQKPFYNALHPKVQALYLSVFNELAERLKGCKSFAGISSRLMIGWQWQGWNVLPGLTWGYDDWTIAQFQKETGLQVPGSPGDPGRFRQRFEFLTGPKLEEWQRWRCARILDYHRRLRDTIRKVNPRAALYFTSPDLPNAITRTWAEKLREVGIDLKMYAKEPGIVILPVVDYGRRFTTPLADALLNEPVCDPDYTAIGTAGDRGFMFYGSYFEVCNNMDWKPLGAELPGISFDSCAPGGRNELEYYAAAMAECDCSALLNGGNGDIFGTPACLREFLAEYKALPPLPFTPLPQGRDPVAIWHRNVEGSKLFEGGFYFYAVNRERYPATVTLTLKGVKKIVSAASDEEVKLSSNQLKLTLAPYQMRAFKALGGSPAIANCITEIPAEEKALLEKQLTVAARMAEEVKNRSLASDLPLENAMAFVSLVSEAQKAFTEGCYWRARINLERPAAVRIYDLVGQWPEGVQDRKVPRGFVKAPNTPAAPKVEFAGEQTIIGDVRGRLSGIKDLAFDAQGNLWAASAEQVMEFDASGKYLRSLRFITPLPLDSGDPRESGQPSPLYPSLEALRVLPDGRLAAMGAYEPLTLNEPETGRPTSLATGCSFNMPGNPNRHLEVDAKGGLYVACHGPTADAVGVWKYNPNGTAAFDFGSANKSNRLCPIAAAGIAVDGTGRIYVSDRADKKIHVYAADGGEQETLDTTVSENDRKPYEPSRLAVTRDGHWLFVATTGGEVVGYQRDANHQLAEKWRQPGDGRVTALAVSPSKKLVLGFEQPRDDDTVAGWYTFDEKGLAPAEVSIPSSHSLDPAMLAGDTPLKEFDGKLYYLSQNRLVCLTPGNPDKVEVVFAPENMPDLLSFAFAPNGDLYLGSNGTPQKREILVLQCKKGAYIWKDPQSVSGDRPLHSNGNGMIPFDVGSDAQGRLIVRWSEKNDWDRLQFYTRDSSGKMTSLMDLGSWWRPGLGPWNGYFGIHLDRKSGKIYLAGGGTRSVVCLSKEGKLLWRIQNKPEQGPDSLPIRGPWSIATDRHGRVWVADTDANRILCFDGEGHFLSQFGHFGTVDGRDGRSFCRPTGLATVQDAEGREWLYVADAKNQRILKYGIE